MMLAMGLCYDIYIYDADDWGTNMKLFNLKFYAQLLGQQRLLRSPSLTGYVAADPGPELAVCKVQTG